MSSLASRDCGTKRASRLLPVQCVLKDRRVVLDPRVPLSTLAAFAVGFFFFKFILNVSRD